VTPLLWKLIAFIETSISAYLCEIHKILTNWFDFEAKKSKMLLSYLFGSFHINLPCYAIFEVNCLHTWKLFDESIITRKSSVSICNCISCISIIDNLCKILDDKIRIVSKVFTKYFSSRLIKSRHALINFFQSHLREVNKIILVVNISQLFL